jgi:drug/metabolite transporter (DMT)-like permease
MELSRELITASIGLLAAVCWGAGDFSGGVATRRANVYVVLFISQIAGLVLIISFALATQESFPTPTDLFWGAVSGLSGVIGLMSLYRALAIGQMGIAAPIAAVSTNFLPLIVSAFTEGIPGPVKIIGFLLALVGVWLLSRPSGPTHVQPDGVRLALLAGMGFGGFIVFIHQASSTAVYWPLVASRIASLSLLSVILLTRHPEGPPRNLLPVIILAGSLDIIANALFVVAAQWGRLDVASVLSSLYPASTVFLAWFLLKERITRVQFMGVLAALVAIVLITT